ncbi:MAG: response regulator transcription factor [Bacteroidales bacterium]|nr:response regulator transcription factor [Bacteroidales bacterium]
MKNTKIILADANVYFREALKTTLEDIGNVEIVAQFSKAVSFLDYVASNYCDIIFIDTNFEKAKGTDIIKMALQINHSVKIYIFSSSEQNCRISEYLAAGAHGYLSKCRNNINLLKEILINKTNKIFISEGIFTNNIENTNFDKNLKIKKTISIIENNN